MRGDTGALEVGATDMDERQTVVNPLGKLLAITLLALSLALGAVAGAAQAGTGKVITIKGVHTIHTHAQADRWLGRTPESFRDFKVKRSKRVQQLEEESGASASCVRNAGVAITKYHTRGYATGGEGGCGGVATLYTDFGQGARHGGSWRLVKCTQDSFYCPVLERYRVPSALVGTACYSPARHDEVPYHQG